MAVVDDICRDMASISFVVRHHARSPSVIDEWFSSLHLNSLERVMVLLGFNLHYLVG